MQFLRKSFPFVLIAAIIIVLSGCKKDGNSVSTDESALIGTWVLTKVIVTTPIGRQELTPEQAGLTMTVVIKSDKTYQQSQTTQGQPSTESGTWSTSNGTLNINSSTGNTMSFTYRITGGKLQLDTSTIDSSSGATMPMTLEYTKQ